VLVGKFVRSSLRVGRNGFAVALSKRALHALARRRRLALTVKVLVTPTHGRPVTLTRTVVDRP
jgi:hypothetical protein